jgi:biotin transport system substrate-specific component
MAYLTYADVLRPAAQRNERLYDAALILSGSLLVALSAQIAIRLPFSPVPITGQTLAVLLVGALLGARRGSLALLAYLAEGAAGLPVFANGSAGPTYMSGPTGGYLFGFVLAAGLTGALAERGWDRRVWLTALAMVLGNVVIYACGLVWLSTFVGIERAPELGMTPFIVGDLLKIALAAALLPSGWVLLGTRGYSR